MRLYEDGELKAEYRYNSFGERIKKVVYRPGKKQGKVTYYLYDGHQLTAEADQAGEITAQYLYLGEQALAKLEGRQIYALHGDPRGAPLAATDKDGATVWSADYRPYGQVQLNEHRIELNLRLPGQYADEESGTYYNYTRDYDPATGRYLTADPIGLAGGINAYAYAGGDPLSFIDPLGLTAQSLGALSGGSTSSLSATGDCPDGDGLSTLDKVHLALGAASIFLDATGVGGAVSWIPDLLDGVISIGEGDFIGGGLSLGAMIPFIGSVGNTAKIARITRRVRNKAPVECLLETPSATASAAAGSTMTVAADASSTNSNTKTGRKCHGRGGKQGRLRELLGDDKLGRADRGWILQEINSIRRGNRKTIRLPPGKELAHFRGREARKGFGYEHSHLQDKILHIIQHKFDNWGRGKGAQPPKTQKKPENEYEPKED